MLQSAEVIWEFILINFLHCLFTKFLKAIAWISLREKSQAPVKSYQLEFSENSRDVLFQFIYSLWTVNIYLLFQLLPKKKFACCQIWLIGMPIYATLRMLFVVTEWSKTEMTVEKNLTLQSFDIKKHCLVHTMKYTYRLLKHFEWSQIHGRLSQNFAEVIVLCPKKRHSKIFAGNSWQNLTFGECWDKGSARYRFFVPKKSQFCLRTKPLEKKVPFVWEPNVFKIDFERIRFQDHSVCERLDSIHGIKWDFQFLKEETVKVVMHNSVCSTFVVFQSNKQHGERKLGIG